MKERLAKALSDGAKNEPVLKANIASGRPQAQVAEDLADSFALLKQRAHFAEVMTNIVDAAPAGGFDAGLFAAEEALELGLNEFEARVALARDAGINLPSLHKNTELK